MKRYGRRTTTIAAGSVILLVGAGAAFAYWTNSGTGAGDADTGTNVAIVVNQTSTVTGMAPGVAAQSLSGNFDNPNAGPVYVAAVTATVTGTDMPGCGATDYTIAGTATVAAQVPAGTGVGSWSGLTIQFNNKAGVNQDVCKNANVVIAYASS
jgi:hypothetical protein